MAKALRYERMPHGSNTHALLLSRPLACQQRMRLIQSIIACITLPPCTQQKLNGWPTAGHAPTMSANRMVTPSCHVASEAMRSTLPALKLSRLEPGHAGVVTAVARLPPGRVVVPSVSARARYSMTYVKQIVGMQQKLLTGTGAEVSN